MLQRIFYQGPVATTVESYRERIDFARTVATAASVLLVVMTVMFVWSATTVFPLGDTHGLLATAIVAIKALAAVVIVGDVVFLVTSLRDWRRLSRELAAFRGR
ncbi:hypothetical protein Xcel_0357 [Xylanimonas cellulosilytica DSM 15894]|uniref:Uncharacterized protein n=1 Tax=Xylanimonas cellulosilytica (strain DSM 15894 / JCM 12276 / CECT 5975 / KCTC 9989 / LMG 20990 / NBRC 107835 / XIL07) TaxID=446471 RepID=D1BVC5_XYLCX|nr:hypothetical protein [Xylanimonas cellulosilytica]ACZ29396.1 hypothetical protein Xcel_0357 [Xylanimonas cellulosilytica DSM 15894]